MTILCRWLLAFTLCLWVGDSLAKPLSTEDICEPTKGDGPKKAFWLTVGDHAGNDYAYMEIPTTYLHFHDNIIFGKKKFAKQRA